MAPAVRSPRATPRWPVTGERFAEGWPWLSAARPLLDLVVDGATNPGAIDDGVTETLRHVREAADATLVALLVVEMLFQRLPVAVPAELPRLAPAPAAVAPPAPLPPPSAPSPAHASQSEYGAENIKALEGLEAVRSAPGCTSAIPPSVACTTSCSRSSTTRSTRRWRGSAPAST